MSLLVSVGEAWMEGLLTAAEMNQTAASPKPSPSRVTAHKTGNLEDTAQPAGHSSG